LDQRSEKTELKRGGTEPWGRFKVQLGESGHWRLGPCDIWIKRSAKEWLLAVVSGRDYLSTDAEVRLPVSEDEWPSADEARYARYARSETNNQVTLWPELSPISVVFSPETPIFVSPEESVTLYVSTPLWVRLETGDPPGLIDEFPCFRPSDTWFGPNTMEGEHCFAVKMRGRLQLENLPSRVHRAVTPIQIRNRSTDVLSVDQVRLPVQMLSLYRDADRMLWTQPVVLEREANGGAVLHLKEDFHKDARDMELVRAPREAQSTSFVSRAWHWFFRRDEGA